MPRPKSRAAEIVLEKFSCKITNPQQALKELKRLKLIPPTEADVKRAYGQGKGDVYIVILGTEGAPVILWERVRGKIYRQQHPFNTTRFGNHVCFAGVPLEQ